MRVQTIIKDVHFALRPAQTVTHFRARKVGDTLATGPRFTSQTSTRKGAVIQRDYEDRQEWEDHRAVISAKLASYHRDHGKLKGCQCAYCAS